MANSTTSVPVEVHRERMLRHLRDGSPYQFLHMADPYLYVCPADHEVRLLAAREYLGLGLIAPARHLLDRGNSGGSMPPEIAKVADSLANVAGGSVSWAEQTPVFENNLAVLASRGIDVHPIREAWSKRHRDYQLFRDRDDMFQVRARDDQRRWRWIPLLGHHQALADAVDLPFSKGDYFPGPFALEGLDLGYFFERLYRETSHTFLSYSCAIYVVEPDPAVFAIPLHLHDWQELLGDERVHLFLGGDGSSELARAWHADPNLPLPSQVFSLNAFRPGCVPPTLDVARQTVATRHETEVASARNIESLYADRDIRYWARRFDEAISGQGKPLRILAAVSMHTTFLQHSMRDTQHALEALGHQCVVLKESRPFETMSPLTYHDAIRELDPDLFLNIDHIRPEFSNRVPTNLPVMTWDQDQLPQVFTEHNMSQIARHDFLVGYSKDRFITAGHDPRQFRYARVPTCPEQFGGEALSDDERERFSCDVSYVSHASQTPWQFHEQERAQSGSPEMAEMLDVMYELTPRALEQYRTMSGKAPLWILDEAERRTGRTIQDRDTWLQLSTWYLWRLGDRMFRHQALEWAAAWATKTGRSLRIYGHGWEDHPTLSPFAAGPVTNGRELLCVYRASRINLQLMPAGFIHQRALDGLAAGGFFLARAVPHDTRGRLLRTLIDRIETLAIASKYELAACPDPALRSLLAEYMGYDGYDPDSDRIDTLKALYNLAELDYPDEVFEDFSEITFDNADGFNRLADRFLADKTARLDITHRMRKTVIQKFSYKAAIQQFLIAMRDYLKAIIP